MGSRKFLSLVIVLYCMCSVVAPLVLYLGYLLPVGNINHIFPGQTAVIVGLTALYYNLIPVVYRFQLSPVSTSGFKLRLSDKTFIYLVAFQLSMSHFPGSAVTATVGWIISTLVHYEVIPGKNWRMPFYSTLGLDTTETRLRPSTPEQQQQQQQEGETTAERRPLTSQLLDPFRT